MTSKISWRTRLSELKQTYLWVLKKERGMAALLAVLLFCGMPVMLLLALSSYRSQINGEQPAHYIADSCQSFLRWLVPGVGVTLTLVFALVMCVRLFSYMQNRRSADLFHAAPVGRIPMLLGRWCAGMTVLAAPLLLNLLIVWIILAVNGVPATVQTMSLGAAGLWILLMGAAAFTLCAFFAVCSGSVMDTVLSVLGVNVGFPALVLLGSYVVRSTVPGMNTALQPVSESMMTLFAPFIAAYLPFLNNTQSFSKGSGGTLPAWFLPWWICFTVALLVFSCLFYRRRRSESAEDSYAFPAPKIAVRFLVTACGGLALGYLFAGAGFFLAGLLIGSIVAYVVTEALYSRGFSTLKKSVRGYAAFLVVSAAFFAVLATGCFGYDTRVPEESEVQSVRVSMGSGYRSDGSIYVLVKSHQYAELEPVLKQPENLRSVLKTHKSIASWYRANCFPYRAGQIASGSGLTFTYQLKNGRTLTRSFGILQRGYSYTSQRMENDWYALSSMKEYRASSDVAFFVQPGDITGASVGRNDSGSMSPLTLTDSDRVMLLTALREQRMTADWRKLEQSGNAGAYLSLDLKENIPIDEQLKETANVQDGSVTVTTVGGNYRYEDSDALGQAVKAIQNEHTSGR